MNTIDKIRAEIERRKNKWSAASRLVKKGKDTAMYAAGKSSAYTEFLSFLDTLPDESEQPIRGYDEAYLNEKIAKASKSWEGVDVDKFMDEIRGREPVSDCHDLEKEIKEQIYERFYDLNGIAVIGTSGYAEVKDMEDIARHFAKWGANHLRDTTKKVSEDLKEAAKKYAEEQEFWWIRENPYTSQEYAFKAGAEWKKAKMMEGAVEGVVWWQVGKNISIRVLKGASKYLEQDDLPYKVRMIILPKEGEE